MSEVYDQIKEQIDKVITTFEQQSSDGYQLEDIWPITDSFVESTAAIVELVEGVTDEQKKEAIKHATGELYDRVIGPIDLPWVPNRFEQAVVDPIFGRVFVGLCGYLIDNYLARAQAADQ